jgi:hypothetical protein
MRLAVHTSPIRRGILNHSARARVEDQALVGARRPRDGWGAHIKMLKQLVFKRAPVENVVVPVIAVAVIVTQQQGWVVVRRRGRASVLHGAQALQATIVPARERTRLEHRAEADAALELPLQITSVCRTFG